jgi:uncharacterized membrane protein
VTLSVGLLLSLVLLLGGLLLARETLLRAGVLILMFTPVVRVVVVTLGLLRERDWLFAGISAFVLGVILSGMLVAARL